MQTAEEKGLAEEEPLSGEVSSSKCKIFKSAT